MSSGAGVGIEAASRSGVGVLASCGVTAGAGVLVGNGVAVGSGCSVGTALGVCVGDTVGAAIAVGSDVAAGNGVCVGYGVCVGSGVYVGNADWVAGTAMSVVSEPHPRSASATLTNAAATAAVLNVLMSNTSEMSAINYQQSHPYRLTIRQPHPVQVVVGHVAQPTRHASRETVAA